jgi:hypothetical protein
MEAREYKFSESLNFDTSFRGLSDRIQNAKLKEVAESFSNNMERVFSLGLMPEFLVNMYSKFYKYSLESAINTLSILVESNERMSKYDDDLQDKKPSELLASEHQEQFEKMMKERQQSIKRRREDAHVAHLQIELHKEDLRNPGTSFRLGFANPDELVARMLTVFGLEDKDIVYKYKQFMNGLDATMTGMTIGAWTAFETLSTDVWINSVNMKPMTLGVNALLGRKKREKASGQAEPDESEQKHSPMSFDILKEYKFNLGSCLGTMIHSKRKYDFNALEGIGHAYGETFCVRDRDGTRKGKMNECKTWFSGEDHQKLQILEAVRHVLVHRAGQVDRPFLDRIEGRYLAFGNLSVGDSLLLDGGIVADLVGASVRRALALIEGVDKWLAKPE